VSASRLVCLPNVHSVTNGAVCLFLKRLFLRHRRLGHSRVVAIRVLAFRCDIGDGVVVEPLGLLDQFASLARFAGSAFGLFKPLAGHFLCLILVVLGHLPSPC
jgi:hypothetical protein